MAHDSGLEKDRFPEIPHHLYRSLGGNLITYHKLLLKNVPKRKTSTSLSTKKDIKITI